MLLVEFDKITGVLIGASKWSTGFIDLPETSASCLIEDKETADAIWISHTNKGEVVIQVDEQGMFMSAEIEEVTPVVPETPKTHEQLRIEQLESDNLTLKMAIFDLYTMIVPSEAE
ncbi:hypothetical protein [Paenibacillus sp. NRS-1760]|uniref:hypothetical protein n=1 Tax=Paenibacillus sp. NRS-1760 TaxID=3233902 RepID=UPI003D2C6AB0